MEKFDFQDWKQRLVCRVIYNAAYLKIGFLIVALAIFWFLVDSILAHPTSQNRVGVFSFLRAGFCLVVVWGYVFLIDTLHILTWFYAQKIVKTAVIRPFLPLYARAHEVKNIYGFSLEGNILTEDAEILKNQRLCRLHITHNIMVVLIFLLYVLLLGYLFTTFLPIIDYLINIIGIFGLFFLAKRVQFEKNIK